MAGLVNVGEMGALALHVLVDLAGLRKENPEARRSVQEMAEALCASPHTLHKVARRLVVADMLAGTRGASGGLSLVKDPGEITMLAIIEAVEGKINTNGCLFAKRVCGDCSHCRFAGLTGGLEKMLLDYFSKTTLADLCALSADELAALCGKE